MFHSLLFFLSAILQFFLYNHHKKEKKYGPSPKNGYTSGSAKAEKKPFFGRNKKETRDVELGAVGAGGALAAEKHNKHNSTIRPSHDTATTGSTAANPDLGYTGQTNKYTSDPLAHQNNAAYSHANPIHKSHDNHYDGLSTGHHNHSNIVSDDSPHIHNNGFPHIEPPSHGGQVPHGPMPGSLAHDFDKTTYGRTNY